MAAKGPGLFGVRSQVVVLESYLNPGALLRPSLVAFITSHHFLSFMVGSTLEGHSDIFFAGAQEVADTDNERRYFSGFIHQNILNVADLVFVRIIDILLVTVGNGDCLARQCRLHRSHGKITGRIDWH